MALIDEAYGKAIAELSKLGISKDSKNQSQGFSFRGIDDCMAALSPVLVNCKLGVVPRTLGFDREEYENKSGNKQFRTLVTVEYTLRSTEDGSSIVSSFVGEGVDNGDKATGKAYSMAFKQWAFQMFCIPVEGQDDADKTTPEHAKANAPTTKVSARRNDETPPLTPDDVRKRIAAAESKPDLMKLVPAIRVFDGQDRADLTATYRIKMAEFEVGG